MSAQNASNLGRYTFSSLNHDKELCVPGVHTIAEGADGVMWLSTRKGVVRYNGQQLVHYQLSKLGRKVSSSRSIRVVRGEQGHLWAFDDKGRIYQYDEVHDQFEPRCCINDYTDQELSLYDLREAGGGRLWVATSLGLILLQGADSLQWVLSGVSVRHLNLMGAALLVASDQGLYSIAPDGRLSDMLYTVDSPLCSYFDSTTGYLWLGTFHRGMQLIDTRTWKPLFRPALSQVPLTPVRKITPLDSCTLLVGNDGAGLYAVDRQCTSAIPMFANNPMGTSPLHGTGIYDICVDRESNLWIATYTGGIDIAFPAEHLAETIRHIENNPNSLFSEAVNDILETPDGTLWFGAEEGVSYYQPATGRWGHMLADVAVLDLAQTTDGRVLAATYGQGTYYLNPDGTTRKAFCVANGMLESDYVYQLYAESDGTLWAGCLDGRLARIRGQRVDFFPVRYVQCISQITDGDIAIGTANGWYRISGDGHDIVEHMLPPDDWEEEYNLNITSVFSNQSDLIWLGSEGGGVYVCDMLHPHIEKITTENGLPSDVICSMSLDNHGNLIVTTDNGIAVINPSTHHVSNVNYLPEIERIYMRQSSCRMLDGRLAFGSTSGVVIIDPERLNSRYYEASLKINRLTFEGIDPQQQPQWRAHVHQMLQQGEMRLPATENTFMIHFESVCFANQHDILYQTRLVGYDDGWSVPTEHQDVQYSRLPSGQYRFLVRCISRNDGHEIASVGLPIVIDEPWWNTWWAWMGYILLLLAFLYSIINYVRERQIRWANANRTNFFIHIAHDLRTPLSLIVSPIEHLVSDKNMTDEQRQYLETARTGCRELQSLVTQVLDINRYESKRFNSKPLHLRDLLLRKVHLFETLAQDRQIELTLEPIDGELTVIADQTLTDSILENLLSNALKYTPACGSVTVSATASVNKVSIQVSDTGIGIPLSEQSRIFGNYYRATNAAASQQEGTGLGLALSYNLARLQDGRLSFTSQEGVGSTFVLELPRGKDQIPEPEVSLTSAEMADPSATLRPESEEGTLLLFVDDNASLRQFIKLAFNDHYQVVTMPSAEEALAYLQTHPCDIVVSDVKMPGMHGDAFCRHLKDNPETSWLPVILLTGNADRESMLAGLDAGADDYLLKPFDETILRGKIDSLLANRRRLSRYYLDHTIQMAGHQESTPAGPQLSEMSDRDKIFIERATRLVLDNLSDGDYTIDSLCRDMGMSRTSFFGFLKSLTSQSPQQFVRVIRMERAASLLRDGHSVSEVSVETGFASVKYFSIVFKSYFGISPSKYT